MPVRQQKPPKRTAKKNPAESRARANQVRTTTTDDDEIHGRRWNLRLYVAGQTPKSVAAFANLRQLCEKHMPGKYEIEVIDLMRNPQLAAGDQIVAVPTLIRRLPKPLKRIIGSLSDEAKFLVGMDVRPE